MTESKLVRLFLITGMSGAGKSSALHALEDLDFETVDNLPVHLLETVLRGRGLDRPLAVGMDVRTRDFNATVLVKELNSIADKNSKYSKVDLTLIFLECDDDILVRRYTETRRPHPMDGELPIGSAIELERHLLSPIKAIADNVIDTSTMAIADLKRSLEQNYAQDDGRPMHIHLVSFGYRHGLPRDADLIIDVRFMRNPHYVIDLRHKTGLDADVGAYVKGDPAFAPFMKNFKALLDPLLPCYRNEGKSYLTIAIGCTGGHHRSVFVLEKLASWLMAQGYACDHRHRDIEV